MIKAAKYLHGWSGHNVLLLPGNAPCGGGDPLGRWKRVVHIQVTMQLHLKLSFSFTCLHLRPDTLRYLISFKVQKCCVCSTVCFCHRNYSLLKKAEILKFIEASRIKNVFKTKLIVTSANSTIIMLWRKMATVCYIFIKSLSSITF